MLKRLILFMLIVCSGAIVIAQNKITRDEYIETYADLAMQEMARTGIPASITIAQGCLESDNGNSRLTRDANNHFGIKCHDWTGRKIYHDDDEKNECFRKYRSAEESYSDHSSFLTEKSRYAELFTLKPDDYKGWAKGLKKAGYATSNKYADLLISIIEENELYYYDDQVLSKNFNPKNIERNPEAPVIHRQVLVNNRVEYIHVKAGDTPESLREELNLYRREIYRYNDLEKGVALEPGMVIYLQPKRRKALKDFSYHELGEGETLWDISQKYAVKLDRLYKMNNLNPDAKVEAGTKIYLRKKQDSPESISEENDEGDIENNTPNMKFKFE